MVLALVESGAEAPRLDNSTIPSLERNNGPVSNAISAPEHLGAKVARLGKAEAAR